MTDTAQTASSPTDRADRSAVAVVQLEQVVKAFGSVLAVDHLDLEIRRGEFFSMLGPSGCGKTTTLRIIGGCQGRTGDAGKLTRQAITAAPGVKRGIQTGSPSHRPCPHPYVIHQPAPS